MWVCLSHTCVRVMYFFLPFERIKNMEHCWKPLGIKSEKDDAQFTGHSTGNPPVIQVCIWIKFHPRGSACLSSAHP